MIQRIKSTWLKALSLFLIVVLTLPAIAQAKNVQAPLSMAMKSLLKQVNSQYLSRFGTNVDGMVNDDPMMFSSILGVTLQRQTNYAVLNPQYGNQYWKLRDECLQLLAFIAKQKDYKNPKNGNKMRVEDLESEFYEGISGTQNPFFIGKLGFDPATVNLPMVLAKVVLSQQGGGTSPAPSPTQDEILIGGKTASAAESTVKGVRVGQAEKPDPVPQEVIGNFPGNHAYKIKGRMCPVIHPGGWNPKQELDTNNNPGDSTKVTCYYGIDYGKLRLLSDQHSYVNGKKHGLSLQYKKVQDGRIYLTRTFEYKQGEQWQGAAYYDNGKPRSTLERKNGEKISTSFRMDGTKKRMNVKKGNNSLSEEYYPNGQISIRYINNNYAGSWCSDGSRSNMYTKCK